MKELLEAGVHFGHQTKRWNPKMKEYIFGERNGIYIVDLQKTLRLFREALLFATQLGAEGKTILFIGTKRQAQEVVAEEAARAGMYFVNQRWLGGTLTNFVTIQKSIGRFKELTALVEGGGSDLTKKELSRLDKERKKLEKNLSGIQEMQRLPDAIFVIDARPGQGGGRPPRAPPGKRRRSPPSFPFISFATPRASREPRRAFITLDRRARSYGDDFRAIGERAQGEDRRWHDGVQEGARGRLRQTGGSGDASA